MQHDDGIVETKALSNHVLMTVELTGGMDTVARMSDLERHGVGDFVDDSSTAKRLRTDRVKRA